MNAIDNNMTRSSALPIVSIVVLGLLGRSVTAADPADKYPGLNLIPWPKAVQVSEGRMKLTVDSRIVAGQEELKPLAEVLSGEIALLTGLKLKVVSDAGQPGDIVLKINKAIQAGVPGPGRPQGCDSQDRDVEGGHDPYRRRWLAQGQAAPHRRQASNGWHIQVSAALAEGNGHGNG